MMLFHNGFADQQTPEGKFNVNPGTAGILQTFQPTVYASDTVANVGGAEVREPVLGKCCSELLFRDTSTQLELELPAPNSIACMHVHDHSVVVLQ
jgi:hypothetical protein